MYKTRKTLTVVSVLREQKRMERDPGGKGTFVMILCDFRFLSYVNKLAIVTTKIQQINV